MNDKKYIKVAKDYFKKFDFQINEKILENEKLKKIGLTKQEIEKLPSRELLYRYSSVSEAKGMYTYLCMLKEVNEARAEREMYELELLKRLAKENYQSLINHF